MEIFLYYNLIGNNVSIKPNMSNKSKMRFRGINTAARESGVCRVYIWRCCTGRRRPSTRVADAIKKYVVAYVPIRTDAEQPSDAPRSN